MVLVNGLGLLEILKVVCIQVAFCMINVMVKEHLLGLMERNMKVIG